MKKKTPLGRKRPLQLGRVRPLREHIAALALLRKRMPDLVRRHVNPVKKSKDARRATHEDALKELE